MHLIYRVTNAHPLFHQAILGHISNEKSGGGSSPLPVTLQKTSVGWYDPIKTTGYINRSQPSVWLTRNHLFQMLWFDLLETKDCLFLLLSWGKQMLIGWPLVVGVRILKTNRGSIAEAAVAGAGAGGWSGVREKYYWLAGGWKLVLERCERKTLLGWRLLELPNRVTTHTGTFGSIGYRIFMYV